MLLHFVRLQIFIKNAVKVSSDENTYVKTYMAFIYVIR
jgi:hypothetical protein